MNTGNPKLLVIPAEVARSDGPEGASSQDRILFYRRKQRRLQKRIIQTCLTIWQLLVQVGVFVCGVCGVCVWCVWCFCVVCVVSVCVVCGECGVCVVFVCGMCGECVCGVWGVW